MFAVRRLHLQNYPDITLDPAHRQSCPYFLLFVPVLDPCAY